MLHGIFKRTEERITVCLLRCRSWWFRGHLLVNHLKLMWNKGWWFLKGKTNENCVSEQFHSVWKSTKCLIWIFMWNFFFLNSRMKKRKRANMRLFSWLSNIALLFYFLVLIFWTLWSKASSIKMSPPLLLLQTFLKILSFVKLKRIYYGMTDRLADNISGLEGDFFILQFFAPGWASLKKGRVLWSPSG